MIPQLGLENPAERRCPFTRLPSRVRLGLRLVGLQWALLLLYRAIFYFAFRDSGGELGLGELSSALWVGARFDLRLVLIVTAPFLLAGCLPWLDPRRGGGLRRAWLVVFVVLGVLLSIFYAFDFGNYDYLHERITAEVLDQALSPAIAAQMVWETYPVIPGLLALLVFAGLWTWVLRRLALVELDRPEGDLPRRWRWAPWTALVFLVAGGIYGKLSWYPLRWSDAFVFGSPFATSLALNPVLFFVDSIPNRGVPYDEERVREHYDELARLLEVDEPDREALEFGRTFTPAAPPVKRRNLIIIHLESWSGFQTGNMAGELNPSDELDPSPRFDALCEDGYLYTNFFVPRGPTSRSVWAMVTGVPDMNPLRSASRNPSIVRQHTLIEALEGYEKYYFLGGSATWANIRGLLAHNIEGLHIYEEGDYTSARGDVWGISDLAMFEEAVEVLERIEEPFFCFLQTSGNHRPYTIPEDKRGFEVAEGVDPELLMANGFASLEAYNGFRFLDHSLGHFFDLAREQGFFESTIFMMYGDHGVPAPHGIPWENLSLPAMHVPLLIYAPGLIEEGRRYDHVTSSVDLLPTALEMLGVPHFNQGMGRDLLVERPESEHFAFLQDGLLTDEYCLRLDPTRTARLYRYRSESPAQEVSAEFPEVFDELRRRYEALEEWCFYMLYHNTPRSHPDGGERVP